MTKEKAIKILRISIQFMDMFKDESAREQTEAYTLAINALEQDDLISRAELFNKLSYLKAPPEANGYKTEVYELIQSMEVKV